MALVVDSRWFVDWSCFVSQGTTICTTALDIFLTLRQNFRAVFWTLGNKNQPYRFMERKSLPLFCLYNHHKTPKTLSEPLRRKGWLSELRNSFRKGRLLNSGVQFWWFHSILDTCQKYLHTHRSHHRRCGSLYPISLGNLLAFGFFKNN